MLTAWVAALAVRIVRADPCSAALACKAAIFKFAAVRPDSTKSMCTFAAVNRLSITVKLLLSIAAIAILAAAILA